MKKSRVREHIRFVLLGILVAICAGCFGLSAENRRPGSLAANSAVGSETNEQSTQPSAVKAAAPAQTGTSEDKTKPHQAEDKASRVGLSEEEKANSLAVDLAKDNPGVKKIKVCHDKRSDEWWLILYEDAGSYLRLRQYTWSIEHDQPEEFLVDKRISKSKLESHLADSENDRVCKVVEYERGGRLPALAASESSAPPSRSKEILTQHKPASGSDVKKMPVRKPDISERANETQASTPAKTRPAGVAQPQTNTIATVVQAPAKQSPSEVAPRKAVAPPEKGAFVQATAKNSPNEIASLREGISVDRPAARPRVPPEKSARAKAKIISDSGVFSLAAVRPEPKSAVSLREGKPRSNPGESRSSLAAAAKKAPLPDAGAALTGPEKESGLMSSEKTADQPGDVPTSFVFVYGSEMNHQELLSWLKANNYDSTVILDVTPGVLDEHDLIWNYYSPSRGGGTVNLVSRKNTSVWGLLVEVEDRGLKAFDRKAGHPSYYTRGENRMSVKRVNDGRTVFAWLYRAKPNKSGSTTVWPTEEYKQKIVEAANFWQFPRWYVEKLESLPTR